MDEIAFVVAERELGIGPQVCAEPIINGEPLCDMLARVDGTRTGYAGLAPSDLAARLEPVSDREDVHVLGCICGDDLCSWARLSVTVKPERITWHDIRASNGDVHAYAALGSFEFSRRQYEHALASLTG
jgi:hypothetical protein